MSAFLVSSQTDATRGSNHDRSWCTHPPASIEVFYSYAHEDEGLVKELRKHLSILKRQGVIREWYDREITAGTDWKGRLDQHLNSSGVILLLVSRFPGLRLLLRRRDLRDLAATT